MNDYLSGSAIISGTFERLGGKDRYATNIIVSRKYSENGGAAFLVTGLDFPDALSASPAAASLGGTLYIVRTNGIPADTLKELERKRPEKIYLIGGVGAISKTVELQAQGIAPTERVGGGDRYETSALIFKKFFKKSSKIFVATGANYPDALSASSVAGSLKSPLLLVRPDSAPFSASELKGSGAASVVIAGGESVVSRNVENWFSSHGFIVDRVAGDNRYETNSLLNKLLGTSINSAWVANGNSYPDALTAAVPASTKGPRLVLSKTSCVPDSSLEVLQSLKNKSVRFVGGPGVLSDSVMLLKGC